MEKVPELNVERLDKVLAWIERENAKSEEGQPSGWFQDSYAVRVTEQREVVVAEAEAGCGTAFCAAGYAAYDAGMTKKHDSGKLLKRYWTREFYSDEAPFVFEDWHTAGQKALGLTEEEADELFAGDNDIEEMRTVVAQIKDGRYRGKKVSE